MSLEGKSDEARFSSYGNGEVLMIIKCYICQNMPKYTYFTDKNGCRKVQMFCRNCHNHSLPKNSDPEAVKNWNDNNLSGFEIMKKIEQGHFI